MRGPSAPRCRNTAAAPGPPLKTNATGRSRAGAAWGGRAGRGQAGGLRGGGFGDVGNREDRRARLALRSRQADRFRDRAVVERPGFGLDRMPRLDPWRAVRLPVHRLSVRLSVSLGLVFGRRRRCAQHEQREQRDRQGFRKARRAPAPVEADRRSLAPNRIYRHHRPFKHLQIKHLQTGDRCPVRQLRQAGALSRTEAFISKRRSHWCRRNNTQSCRD